MAKQVDKALFIGLGGTGYKILLQVKKALIKNYGEMPPSIKILCFDTDVPQLEKATEELTYRNIKGEYVSEQITFSASEMFPIPIRRPDRLKKFPHIKKWLSPKIENSITPSSDGAKQIRSLGRCAFYENYSILNIDGLIQDKLNEINDIDITKNLKYNISTGNSHINLVFSPNGGTGAGTFIDMIMAIRAHDVSINIKAWMVMPEIYTQFPSTNKVIANGYASLTEIDHLMGKDNTQGKPWSNYDIENPFKVNHSGGDEFGLNDSKFLNYVYLFDNKDINGTSVNDIDDVYERIARILHLMVSGTGDDLMSTYSNADDYDTPTSKETGSKRRNFSSAGIAQLVLDKQYIKQIKQNKIYTVILNNLKKPITISEDKFDAIIDSNQWREDRDKDEIINTLMPKNDLKYDIDNELCLNSYNKGSHSNLETQSKIFITNWETKIDRQCKKNLDALFQDFESKLNIQISDFLKTEGGLYESKEFVNYLSGSFDGMRTEMHNESDRHTADVKKYTKLSQQYLDDVINEEDSFNPIKKSSRIEIATKPYIANVNLIVKSKWELIRKTEAKLFYDKAIIRIESVAKQLNSIDLLIDDLRKEVKSDIHTLMNSSFDERDFEIYLHKFDDSLLELDMKDLGISNIYSQIDFSNLLNCNKKRDVINLISDYVSNSKQISEIKNLNVEKALSDLDPGVRSRVLQYLDKASNVLINIDETSFATNTGVNPELNAVILVEDESVTNFKEGGEFSKHFGLNRFVTSGTGNPDVITMIKIKGMFPANAITRIKKWKTNYENSVEHGGYHFIDTYFEENALDLIDPKPEEIDEVYILGLFSAGSALGLINIVKGRISISLKRKKIVSLIEGTKDKTDRSKAFKYFKENIEYIEYIESEITKQKDENRTVLCGKLVEFYNNIDKSTVLGKILTSIDSDSEEFKQIDLERNAIVEFALQQGCDDRLFE